MTNTCRLVETTGNTGNLREWNVIVKDLENISEHDTSRLYHPPFSTNHHNLPSFTTVHHHGAKTYHQQQKQIFFNNNKRVESVFCWESQRSSSYFEPMRWPQLNGSKQMRLMVIRIKYKKWRNDIVVEEKPLKMVACRFFLYVVVLSLFCKA